MNDDERMKKYIDKVMSIKKCARCHKDFEINEQRFESCNGIVCKACWKPDMDSGLKKLNKFLNRSPTTP